MFSKNFLLLVSVGSVASRFDWYDPTTYSEGLYNFATGNAHTFDTEFKSKIYESLLDSSVTYHDMADPQYKRQSRSAILSQIRQMIEEDARA